MADMQILLISDIHANFPALRAIEEYFQRRPVDAIINCGDSLVYAPFPNETLTWLADKNTISILGNTDKKVIKLLLGESINKPTNPEKLVMYTWTADQLSKKTDKYIQSLKNESKFSFLVTDGNLSRNWQIGIFHGSPAKNHEFLFDTTPNSRFVELSGMTAAEIIVCGHSHIPFHKQFGTTHFINPGSVGRMFDGDPRASCALLQFSTTSVSVQHFRISYAVEEVAAAIKTHALPEIYIDMFRRGRKTN